VATGVAPVSLRPLITVGNPGAWSCLGLGAFSSPLPSGDMEGGYQWEVHPDSSRLDPVLGDVISVDRF
jgi:hypothetical protein